MIIICTTYLQQNLTFAMPDILFELFGDPSALPQINSGGDEEESWLGLILGVFVIFAFLPEVSIAIWFANLSASLGFMLLDRYLNRKRDLLQSILIAILTVACSYFIGVLIVDVELTPKLPPEDDSGSKWGAMLFLAASNLLFMLVFVPVWHYKLEGWLNRENTF